MEHTHCTIEIAGGKVVRWQINSYNANPRLVNQPIHDLHKDYWIHEIYFEGGLRKSWDQWHAWLDNWRHLPIRTGLWAWYDEEGNWI